MATSRETQPLSEAARELADADFRMVGTRTALRALRRWCEDCAALGHKVRRVYGDEGLMGVIVEHPAGFVPPLPITCMDALVNRFDHEKTPCP